MSVITPQDNGKTIEVHLRSINKKHFDIFNEIRKKRNYTWKQFFEHMYTYLPIMNSLFTKSIKPDVCTTKSIVTVNTLLPKWCNNIANNMEDIIKSKDVSYLACKTKKDNECWKMKKLKEYATDKVEEYELDFIAKECQLPKEHLSMLIKRAITTNFVPLAGSSICNDCKNTTMANKPALIISGGPSLKTYNHLQLLKKYGFDGDIFVVSRVLKEVLDNGIIPKYVGALDAEEFDTSFFDYDIVDKYSDKITGLFGINIHPTTAKRWKGERHYFMGYISEAEAPNISHVLHLLTKVPSLSVSGNIGSCMYNIASYLGYNPIIMIGMDLSFPTVKSMQEYYSYIPKEYWKTQKINGKKKRPYKRCLNPDFNESYYMDGVFEAYKVSHVSWINSLAVEAGIKTINCSEQGSIHSQYITSIKFEEYLKNKDKYNKITENKGDK